MRYGDLVIAPCLLLGMVGACATLPRSGPYRSDMLDAGAANAVDAMAVVELNPVTVTIVAAAAPPSLAGTFGDSRPPQSQRIGIGDSVQITLWEAGPGGLFSSPVTDTNSAGSRSAVIPEQVVARDGAITVPFAGRVAVSGRTPPEIERAIVSRLADKAINPQALVTMTRSFSNTVTVMGEVGAGARVPLSVGGDHLLDIIATAGGVRTPLHDVVVVITRDGRSLRVPMAVVLNDPGENIFLRPGDNVTLVRDPQSFTAMGATGHSGVVPFDTPALGLDEAIGKAGGLNDNQADPDGVFVVRYEMASVAQELPQARTIPVHDGWVPMIYHLNMREPTALLLARKFPMRNKDIMYVSNASLSDMRKVLSLLNLLVSPAVTAVDVNANVR